MTGHPARPLREVIGDGVRRVREATNVRQDDVSRAARVYGLAWNRSRIATLEAGEKAISAEELALLPLLLSRACQRQVTLADLIPPGERIRLSSTVPATGEALLSIYAAQDVSGIRTQDLGPSLGTALAMAAHPTLEPQRARQRFLTDWSHFQQVEDRVAELLGSHQLDELLAGDASEADRVAARRLGENPMVIVALSRALWGRVLAEERDRVVSERVDAGDAPDRLRALRGRVTRQLVGQLADEIRRRETGGDGKRQEEAGR